LLKERSSHEVIRKDTQDLSQNHRKIFSDRRYYGKRTLREKKRGPRKKKKGAVTWNVLSDRELGKADTFSQRKRPAKVGVVL